MYGRTLPLATALLLAAGAAGAGAPIPPNTAQCLTPAEATLAQLVNTYRVQNGRAAVPVSFSLSSVAQWHVWDLQANNPVGGTCNLHSWSGGMPSLWTAVCYTPDHAQAAQMWNKPRQVTHDAYTASGYEIAYGASGFTATPQGALAAWQGSPGHNEVILNNGAWASRNPWPAMGVGLFGGFAVVWFGDAADALGPMAPCGAAGTIFAHGFENP
jgi:hypothetical protein